MRERYDRIGVQPVTGALGAEILDVDLADELDNETVSEIVEVIKEAEEQHNWGDGWHTDLPFLAEPPMGSVLYARDVPPFSGDTHFANLYLAYETLSDTMQELLADLGTDQIPVIYLYTHERLRPEAHSARGQVVQ